MEIFTLGSGSSGNSTLLVTGNGKRILIDAGLGVNDLRDKLDALGYGLSDIDAVLVTHSHIDHIRCLYKFEPSIIYSPHDLEYFKDYNWIYPFYEYEIADVKVLVLPTSHDTYNGIGFVIYDQDYKLVYMTDTGYVNRKLFKYMDNADCYIFESNHDEQMLLNTNRPASLIRRIMSDVGHLSNTDSARILCRLMGDRTRLVILAHLSEDANTPECAISTFYRVAGELNKDVSRIKLVVAKRYDITTVQEVEQEL